MILKLRRHIYVVANVKIKLFTNEAKSPKITSVQSPPVGVTNQEKNKVKKEREEK